MMSNVSWRRACAALAPICLCASAHGADAVEASGSPPAVVFFRNPEIREAKLSPSGRWLAFTTATKTSRVFLAIVDMADGEGKNVQ